MDDIGHNSQDDIIFVQQIRNDHPVTIDLCNDTFVETRHSTPVVPTRRRRNPIGTVVVASELVLPPQRPRLLSDPVPEKPPVKTLLDTSAESSQNSSLPLKCAICLESSLKNQPVSTFCGHVFCKSCIEQVKFDGFSRCTMKFKAYLWFTVHSLNSSMPHVQKEVNIEEHSSFISELTAGHVRTI